MSIVERTSTRRMKEFPTSVVEHLGHYVYLLADPTTGKPFYVGKGMGNRMFQHEQEAIDMPQRNTAKLQQIRRITAAGNAVQYKVLRHGLTMAEAAEVESAMIDYVCLENLVNKQSGHRADKRGLMTIPEIIAQYATEPAEIKEPAILIKVNKLWKRNITPTRLYDITRGDWVMGKRRTKAKYALAVYRGVIRQVYRIDSWTRVGVSYASDRGKKAEALRLIAKTGTRWRFEGDIACNMQHCVGKRIPEGLSALGAQFPIRYVNCD